MSGSRHAPPMFVDLDGQVRPLTRLRLGEGGDEDGKRREAFIQNLVHDHPGLVPMAEIEPAFAPLISVCRELPTPAGYVDNLWITPWGGIVLGEAKLVRNPQARREVIAQALDYARALAGWSYDDLQNAARIALKQPTFALWDLVRDTSDLDESQYIDAVERRLRTGRLMLLIIGDGIQEGVEALTAHLQLHVGLALLDLSLWRDVNGGLIVVPRVPMRTVLIERGIVRIEGRDVRIDSAQALSGSPDNPLPRPAQPFTQSETEYFDQLSAKRPDLVAPLQTFLAGLYEIGVTPNFGASAILRFIPAGSAVASAGYIETTGKVWFGDAWSTASRSGKPDAGEAYLQSITVLADGQIKRYERSAPQVVDRQGRGIDVAVLLEHSGSWKRAVADLVSALQTA